MAATKVKGLSTYCEIVDLSISKEEAVIKVRFFSNQNNTAQIGLRFYVEDLDLNTVSLLSPKYYWIDKFQSNESANPWDLNVDVLLFKEVILKVNIRNNNLSTFANYHWLRNVRLLLKAEQIYILPSGFTEEEILNSTVWTSEKLQLVSSKVKVPDIDQVIITCVNEIDEPDLQLETIIVTLKYKYGFETDFNYVNDNIQYHFKLINPFVMRNISYQILTENDASDEDGSIGVIKYSFTNLKNRMPLLLDLSIRDVKGNVLKTYSKAFTPVITTNNVYVKYNNQQYKVVATYISSNNPDDLLYNNTGYSYKNTL